MPFRTVITLFFILSLLFSCSEEHSQKREHYIRLRQLEVERSADVNAWQSLYNDAAPAFRKSVILGMGKVKSPDFLPFLRQLIVNGTEEELITMALFSIGQLDTAAAEEFLLSIKPDVLTPAQVSVYFDALGRCGSERTVPFLGRILHSDSDAYYDPALMAAGLLSRKKINTRSLYETVTDTTHAFPLTSNLAYFLRNFPKGADPASVIRRLANADPLTLKYLYQALHTYFSQASKPAIQSFQNDSLLSGRLQAEIRKTLSVKSNWNLQFQALQVLPVVGDSSFIPLLEKLSKQANPHIRIAAYQAYRILFKEDALSFLMNALQSTRDLYLRGQLIIEISMISPKTAFPFINNNLDKGNDVFVGLLLESLSKINSSFATDQLRQFLNVPNVHLRNTAFRLLAEKKALRKNDVEPLLDSGVLSTVSMALNWKLSNNIKTDRQRLLDLFTMYNDPSAFDVQLSVAGTLTHFDYDLTPQDRKQFLAASSHHLVIKELEKALPAGQTIASGPFFNLPPALAADSLVDISYKKAMINTNRGAILIEFFSETAPLTVKNFIHLTKKRFYNGLSFHRVVPDFVIQGGDPTGDGYGGPGYLIPSEDNDLEYERGSVGMATAGRDTGGSQFFICHSAQPHLNGRYTLFAKVIEGMDIVDLILPGDTITDITLLK